MSHSIWIFYSTFFSIYFLCFSICKVSNDVSSSSVILFLAVSSLWINSSKAFFIIWCFRSLAFLLGYFLGFPPLGLYFICSYVSPTLSIRGLSILSTVVLNSWSRNSNIPAISGFNACSISLNHGFCLLVYLIIIFLAGWTYSTR